MKNPFTIEMIHLKNLLLKAIFLVVLSVFLGCSGNYGKLAVNDNVKLQFENYEILSDHQYYFSGSESRPRAVIGVQKAYTLQSRLWQPVDLTSERIRSWLNFSNLKSKYFLRNNGSDILTEDGKKIGIWYAFIDWKDWATIKMINERVVNISTPIPSHNYRFHYREKD